MKIVFFGSGRFGIPCLDAIRRGRNQLAGVFTQPARPAGRKKLLTPTDIALWAECNSIPCCQAEDINAPEIVEKLGAIGGDLLVVIAFGQKISPSVINLYPKGAINVHASLLPKYRGAAPVNRAIMNNETVTGVSIITLADRIDAGNIIAQAQLDILDDDDAGTLTDRLSVFAVPTLSDTIEKIAAGTVVCTPQDQSQATYAPKLKKSDGFLDFAEPADKIRNKIRALWPWPGAQSYFVPAHIKKCYPVTIASAAVVAGDSGSGAFGALDEQLNVICGKDRLKILRLKPAGSGLMDFKDFVNGHAVKPGDVFMPYAV